MLNVKDEVLPHVSSTEWKAKQPKVVWGMDGPENSSRGRPVGGRRGHKNVGPRDTELGEIWIK